MDLKEYKEVKNNLEQKLTELLSKTLNMPLKAIFEDNLEKVTVKILNQQQIDNGVSYVESNFIYEANQEQNLKFAGVSQINHVNDNRIVGVTNNKVTTDLQTLFYMSNLLRTFFIDEGIIIKEAPAKKAPAKEEAPAEKVDEEKLAKA